ncbi:hypothetical protein ACYZUD_01490 [Pseudomonas sp. XS1P51]
MTFSEELQRCKRLMASRLDHDVVRVRPKVRPCFSYRTAATPMLGYRVIRVPLDHERSVEGEEGKSRLHARNFLVHGRKPLLRCLMHTLQGGLTKVIRRTGRGACEGREKPAARHIKQGFDLDQGSPQMTKKQLTKNSKNIVYLPCF